MHATAVHFVTIATRNVYVCIYIPAICFASIKIYLFVDLNAATHVYKEK